MRKEKHMSNIAVIYWSGTGNTEAMARAVAEGANAELFAVSDFDNSALDKYGAFALGCPAMGCEVLEEGEFAPFFEEIKPRLAGKKVALFGSYGWGDGEWMRNWEDTCKADGAVMACEPVICNEAPDGDAAEACKALGAAIAQ